MFHSHPEARNAMNPEIALALYGGFTIFDVDDRASVVLSWGESRAFCAGWDLNL